MLSLITGLPIRFALYAGVALSLSGAAGVAMHEHNNRIRAEVQASADRAIAAESALEQGRIIAQLQDAAKVAEARAEKSAIIRSAINATPSTSQCSSSPAYRALVRELRSAANGSGATGANPR